MTEPEMSYADALRDLIALTHADALRDLIALMRCLERDDREGAEPSHRQLPRPCDARRSAVLDGFCAHEGHFARGGAWTLARHRRPCRYTRARPP
jgi:hypothetical protein